ncbi:hypothetical protein N1851_026550 [Merluccius polli]|uniref:Uncharacterized protein n=1 Tax=Merluccius polli TaxID=89951 RepID=A0AA47NTX8_MERPO|nr:hypothetical protein N1851_026550 [Merluccius polli]
MKERTANQANRRHKLAGRQLVRQYRSDVVGISRGAAEGCGVSLLSSWTAEDKVQLLRSMATLSEMLKRDLLRVCSLPDGSPAVKVPSDGGVVCATIDHKVYCKPMCNHGYDFQFLRRSRPYETCIAGSWTTQYIGGNTLAICFSSTVQISATSSAYFPKDQDCHATQRMHLQDEIFQEFITELSDQQITGAQVNASLICGSVVQ